MLALLKEFREDFPVFEKAKREAIIKTVFDKLSLIPNTEQQQIDLCYEYITYFTQEKRNFLRQRFETKLAHLLSTTKQYQNALNLLSKVRTNQASMNW